MIDRSFLDLLRPPEGYSFVRGLWVTHDLNTATLVELVFPTLARLGVAEPGARYAAWRDLPDFPLTILHAGDRGSYRRPIAAELADIIPVFGRRLHAKYLILQYRRDAAGRPRYRTRAIVTSANLTRGGLSTNLEAWAMEEIDKPQGRFAVRGLLDATARLAQELPAGDRKRVQDRVRQLRGPLQGALASSAIVESLTDKTAGTSLLRGMKDIELDRVAIVTPPFASGDGRAVLAALAPLKSGLRLDLYVGSERTADALRAGAALTFPPGVADELARKFDLHLHGVPGIIEIEGRQVNRPLHAKAVVAFERDGGARILLGSANLTGRGLGGKNRELMLDRAFEDGSEAARWLDALPAVAISAECLVEPGEREELRLKIREVPRLTARFEPDRGQHAGLTSVEGTLRLYGDLALVRRLLLRGEPLAKQPELTAFRLPMEGPHLQAVFQGSSRLVEVLVEIVADEDFYTKAASDADSEQSFAPEFRLLMRDIQRSRQHHSTPEPNRGVSGDRGRFDLDYDRRFPDLIRFASRLVGFSRSELESWLTDYLKQDAAELQMAREVLEVVFGGSVSKDADMRALQGVILGDG